MGTSTEMLKAGSTKAVAVKPKDGFGAELAIRANQFAAALPAHITKERFARVIMTAVNLNPALLSCNRQSLWNAAMKAANDGLLPDGKEGALVPYTGQVQWLPMIAGLRKKVRNSKELSDWHAQVVHLNDEFEYELGDSPFIKHKPFTGGDRGPVIAAYSVATFRGSGDKSREVMTIAELNKVRAMSKASRNDSPWNTWTEEMYRKTVARRHSKILPMNTDLDDVIRRDDALYDFEGASDKKNQTGRLSMQASLDQIAAMPDPEQIEEDGGSSEAKHVQQTGKIQHENVSDAGERQGEEEADDTPTDPREALLLELRTKITNGERVTRLLNGLGERRPLLTDDDVKGLKAAEKALQEHSA